MSNRQAFVIPDAETAYMAVWQTDDKLKFNLLRFNEGAGHEIILDKKILPYLVDVLIKLQNNEDQDHQTMV